MTRKKTTASEESLGELHSALAKVLKEEIMKATAAGESPNAAVLNVARQFLKDNKIEAIPAEGSPLADLASLPVFDEDEYGVVGGRTFQ